MNDAALHHNPRVIAGTLSGFEGFQRFRSPLIDPLRSLLPIAVEIEAVPAAVHAEWCTGLRARRFFVDDGVSDAIRGRLRIAAPLDRFEPLATLEEDPAGPGDGFIPMLQAVGIAVQSRFVTEFRLPWRRGVIELGRRPLVMAVLNVTPDSFSDGGRYANPDRAVARAFELQEMGADLIDVGAESTRPGAMSVSPQEEIARLKPVLRVLLPKLRVPVSVDTMKAEVADCFLEMGAACVNDVSGLEFDPRIAEVAARHRALLIVNHMRGTPRSMQESPRYDDVVAEVCRSLRERVARAVAMGVPTERIIIDPGIGFGKRLEDNLDLLANLEQLRSLGLPILLGCSRKSFLGQLTDRPVEERQWATAATTAVAAQRGVKVVRVHDITETSDLLKVLDAIDARRYVE